MAFLFGPSLEERARLVHALRALESTSIDGLAAALSWSPRRTERIVEQLARRGEGGVYYSPRLRQVRYGPPPELAPPPPPPEGAAGPAPPPPALPHPARTVGPAAAVALGTSPTETGATCPRCKTRMQPTVSGEALVCPACARLALAPTPGSATPKPPEASAAGDRRAQELLASYVTSRPLTCSRCRSPLRHEGVAAFRCPACGQSVRFDGAPAARPPLPRALVPPPTP
jgi:predicted RNA-binding Zn-ribbon protein involved in translation (DUF1610 family)